MSVFWKVRYAQMPIGEHVTVECAQSFDTIDLLCPFAFNLMEFLKHLEIGWGRFRFYVKKCHLVRSLRFIAFGIFILRLSGFRLCERVD